MNSKTLFFTADEQNLSGSNANYASDTVSYIKAVFDLGQNWDGMDAVRAVWYNGYKVIATTLDADGETYVPHEVLTKTGNVKMNLVGSIVEDGELTDRLTTYPIVALVVDAKARVEGTETAEITPSQFEQFVAQVHDEVSEVTGMSAVANTLSPGSDAIASYDDGVLTFGIPRGEKGEKGDDGKVGPGGDNFAFEIVNGHLYVIYNNPSATNMEIGEDGHLYMEVN